MHHRITKRICQFRCDFCFVFFFIQDESVTSVLNKNAGKAFIHWTKIYCLVTKLYEVFNKLQAFLFFLLWVIKVETKENTFCTLGQPIRAQLSCSLAGPTLTYEQQRNWSFIAFFFIHAYRVQLGCLQKLRTLIRDSPERRFIR